MVKMCFVLPYNFFKKKIFCHNKYIIAPALQLHTAVHVMCLSVRMIYILVQSHKNNFQEENQSVDLELLQVARHVDTYRHTRWFLFFTA